MADRIKQFQAFVHIARAKNFTRASEALGLTQPTLSALMSQFEKELGIKLLDRTTRMVELTKAGAFLLPNAERILQDVENTIGALNDTAALFRGQVKFAALPSLCLGPVPKAIGEFGAQHPGIQISLQEELTEALTALVQDGRCEFGVGVLPPEHTGLRFQKIVSDELSLVCHLQHPLARKESVTWAELEDHAVIAMTDATSVRSLIEQASSQFGYNLKYAIEVKNMVTAVAFARAGVGAAIIPSAAMGVLLDGELASARLTEPTLTRDIGILQKADRLLSPAAAELAATLVAHISRESRPS